MQEASNQPMISSMNQFFLCLKKKLSCIEHLQTKRLKYCDVISTYMAMDNYTARPEKKPGNAWDMRYSSSCACK